MPSTCVAPTTARTAGGGSPPARAASAHTVRSAAAKCASFRSRTASWALGATSARARLEATTCSSAGERSSCPGSSARTRSQYASRVKSGTCGGGAGVPPRHATLAPSSSAASAASACSRPHKTPSPRKCRARVGERGTRSAPSSVAPASAAHACTSASPKRACRTRPSPSARIRSGGSPCNAARAARVSSRARGSSSTATAPRPPGAAASASA
mmetsp:Transcript_34378/g.109809  ORF Transcript_34378/g.109809 Transcript_34378/m.109809 type:complete len:214 (-) Transcript_34378:333-974(-)